jgi:hypothetical protein
MARGWWDSAPTVVPWIGGRPPWPRIRTNVNLDDHRERDCIAALLGRGQP